MLNISNHNNFLLSQTTLLSVVKQRGKEYFFDNLCYFKSSHNSCDQCPTPLSFINCLYPLRNKYMPRCYMSMAEYWVDIKVSVIAANYHLAQPKVLSVGIGSDFRDLSITDCWESYYQPNPRLIFHPLFSRGIIIRNNPQFCPLV